MLPSLLVTRLSLLVIIRPWLQPRSCNICIEDYWNKIFLCKGSSWLKHEMRKKFVVNFECINTGQMTYNCFYKFKDSWLSFPPMKLIWQFLYKWQPIYDQHIRFDKERPPIMGLFFWLNVHICSWKLINVGISDNF